MNSLKSSNVEKYPWHLPKTIIFEEQYFWWSLTSGICGCIMHSSNHPFWTHYKWISHVLACPHHRWHLIWQRKHLIEAITMLHIGSPIKLVWMMLLTQWLNYLTYIHNNGWLDMTHKSQWFNKSKFFCPFRHDLSQFSKSTSQHRKLSLMARWTINWKM